MIYSANSRHNRELRALYFLSNIVSVVKSRRMRWAKHVARIEDKKVAYTVLVGRPGGKISHGRSRRRWENNINMDVQEVGWSMDWIDLAQDRDMWRELVNAVMSLRVP
jgi:hypothetical protein